MIEKIFPGFLAINENSNHQAASSARQASAQRFSEEPLGNFIKYEITSPQCELSHPITRQTDYSRRFC